jgi:hypothetical protein
MLQAIFYARFHPERGPSIVHQYPDHSIISPNSSDDHPPPILTWADISAYIIPPYDVCNRPLAICTNDVRVIALPVSLEDAKYARNRFTFNIGFVVAEDEPVQPWEQVLRKTSRFLCQLEIEDGLLAVEEDLAGLKWAGEDGYPARRVGIVHDLLRDVFDQLNDYGEACVQLNDFHVLNLRLEGPEDHDRRDDVSTTHNPVRPWHVPLLIRDLPDPSTWTWDLTLRRIHPYMDGVNHIQRISELADVELRLIKRAVREMIHHGRVILLDIFHYQAVYAGASGLVEFIKDVDVQDECCAYVALPQPPPSSTNSNKAPTSAPAVPSAPPPPTRQFVIELYSALQPGVSVADFCLAHHDGNPSKVPLSALLDVRRLITFGVIKGILRRQQKYALAIADSQVPAAPPQSTVSSPPGLPPAPMPQPQRSSLTSTSSSPTRNPDTAPPAGQPNSLPRSSLSSSNAGTTGTTSSFTTSAHPTRRPSSHIQQQQQQQHDLAAEFDRAWKKAALSSGWATPPTLAPRTAKTTTTTIPAAKAMAKTHPRATSSSSSASAKTTSTASTAILSTPNPNISKGGGGGMPTPNETPHPHLPLQPIEETAAAIADAEDDDDEGGPPALSDEDARLWRFLDGRHPLDQICVEMHWGEKRVVEKLMGGGGGGEGEGEGSVGGAGFGEVVVFCA